MRVSIRLQGPNVFCPDCGRWLVQIHDDGSWDCAPGTSISVATEAFDEIESDDEQIVDGFIQEATCLEDSCRVRSMIAHAITG